ncbi:hypothetical protein NDU88_003939, partial [Pleurodeles waltl]
VQIPGPVDHHLLLQTPPLHTKLNPVLKIPLLQVWMIRSSLVHLVCLRIQLQRVSLGPHLILPPQLQPHLSIRIPPLPVPRGTQHQSCAPPQSWLVLGQHQYHTQLCQDPVGWATLPPG